MKKLARLVSLLLAGVMVMALLAGCSGSFQTNPKVEEQILKYVQDTYEPYLNGKKLTNDTSLHQEAVQILSKVTEDGKIKLSDYLVAKETWYDNLLKAEVKIACVVTEGPPSEDEMLQMKEFTGDVSAFLEDPLYDLEDGCDLLLDFGVATRVIKGKTYVVVAYVSYMS